ncbi:MAG: glycoside hydrolase [Alcanivorax sp.]|nr:glycoside hydrolase [Alcanivorax sp.]
MQEPQKPDGTPDFGQAVRHFFHSKGLHLGIGALLVLGYYASLPGHLWQSTPPFQVAPVPQIAAAEVGSGPAAVPLPLPVQDGHSPAWVSLPEGRLRALWQHQGGLHSATYTPASGDRETGRWSDTETLPPETHAGKGGLDRGVVVVRGARDEVHIYAISGGATPALTLAVQDGSGWHLRSGPLLSALPGQAVRLAGPAARRTDGSHALLVQRGDTLVWLRVAIQEGRQRGTQQGAPYIAASQRLPDDQAAGTAILLADGGESALQLLTPAAEPGPLFWSGTADRGERWSVPQALSAAGTLAPGNSLAALRLAEGDWGLVAVSEGGALQWHRGQDAGQRWRTPVTLADRAGQCRRPDGQATGAPALTIAADGMVHLLYADDGCRLRHQVFSAAWTGETS